MDSTNLINLYISFKSTGAGASMVLYNYLTGLQMSGLLCLIKYSSVPSPLLKVSCSLGLTLSSGFSSLLTVNLGVPGVRDSLTFIALLPNFCSKLLIMDGCPRHPLVFTLFIWNSQPNSQPGCVGSSQRILLYFDYMPGKNA